MMRGRWTSISLLTVLLSWGTRPIQAATIYVPDGGDLQAALNAAQPGDTIPLAQGAEFVGNFVLPNKTGDGWTASWPGGSSARTRWASRRRRQKSSGRQAIPAARCTCAGMPFQGPSSTASTGARQERRLSSRLVQGSVQTERGTLNPNLAPCTLNPEPAVQATTGFRARMKALMKRPSIWARTLSSASPACSRNCFASAAR
jgi:hypothetical protein